MGGEASLFWDRIWATLSLCATSHSHVAPSRNGQPAAGNVCGCAHVHVHVHVDVYVCVRVWMRPPTVRMLYNTFNSWLEQMMWKCKIDVGLTSERSDSGTDSSLSIRYVCNMCLHLTLTVHEDETYDVFQIPCE